MQFQISYRQVAIILCPFLLKSITHFTGHTVIVALSWLMLRYVSYLFLFCLDIYASGKLTSM